MIDNFKVSDLINILQTVDPDLIVVLQKDSEGNGYSPLAGVDTNCTYEPYNGYSGEVKLFVLTAELKKIGFSAKDVGDGEPCVVLLPVN